MTREEWNVYAGSVPLTPDQRGAILVHCDRLGLDDRGERLAVLAALLGRDELESTGDLTLGQAGQLVNFLQRARDRSELPGAAAVADVGRGDDPAAATWVSLAAAVARLTAALMAPGGPQPVPTASPDGFVQRLPRRGKR